MREDSRGPEKPDSQLMVMLMMFLVAFLLQSNTRMLETKQSLASYAAQAVVFLPPGAHCSSFVKKRCQVKE